MCDRNRLTKAMNMSTFLLLFTEGKPRDKWAYYWNPSPTSFPTVHWGHTCRAGIGAQVFPLPAALVIALSSMCSCSVDVFASQVPPSWLKSFKNCACLLLSCSGCSLAVLDSTRSVALEQDHFMLPYPARKAKTELPTSCPEGAL